MKINTENIIALVMAGELKEAMAQLTVSAKYSENETEVALLALRVRTLANEIDQGTILKSDENLERNKITAALLNLLETVKKDFLTNELIYEGVKFFESHGDGITPLQERVYATQFETAKTAYIGWEATLKYPKAAFPIGFLAEWQIMRADGTALTPRLQKEMKISEGWSRSYHTGSWGGPKADNWQTGTYKFLVFTNDVLVVNTEFSVV